MLKRNLLKSLGKLPAFSPASDTQHDLLGIYHGDQDILIGEKQLLKIGSPDPPVPYSQLKHMEILGTKEDIKGLELELMDGTKVCLTGFKTDGKFNDVFAFMRFLSAACNRSRSYQENENSNQLHPEDALCF